MTASGVRSSWLTSARSVRRCSSSASRRAAIVSKPRASSRIGGRSDRVRPDADRVVAVLDPSGRDEHPVEVAGRADRARAAMAARIAMAATAAIDDRERAEVRR